MVLTISSALSGFSICLLCLAAGEAALAQPPQPSQASAPGLGLVEAVQLMLDQDPNLSIEESRVRSSRGVLLTTRAPFDPVLVSNLDQSQTADPLSESTIRERNLLTSSLGLTKRFRTGLSVEPGILLERTKEEVAGVEAANLGTVAFTLRQPLLRGRGREVNIAPERSAERQVAASELDLRQTTSERALTVVSQYWLSRAALLNLEILRESEERARELLETTRKLIEADVIPAADLVQVEANVVAKETARIGGERALFEARQDLGREIGLEPERIAALPLPSDPFPRCGPRTCPRPRTTSAGSARPWSGGPTCGPPGSAGTPPRFLRKAADNALKPQLDLVFTPSYSGLVEGGEAGSFFSPLYRNVPGASSALSLVLSWPTPEQPGAGRAGPDRGGPRAERTRRGARFPADRGRRSRGPRRGGPQTPSSSTVPPRRCGCSSGRSRTRRRSCGPAPRRCIDVISQRDRLTAARQSEVSAQLALAVAAGPAAVRDGDAPARRRIRRSRPTRPAHHGSLPGRRRAVIFRKVALERLSSPEQLDQLLQVTDPKGWLALGALGAPARHRARLGRLRLDPHRGHGRGHPAAPGRRLRAWWPRRPARSRRSWSRVGDVIEKGQVGGPHPPGGAAAADPGHPRQARRHAARSTRSWLRYAGEQRRLRGRDLAQQRANLEQTIRALEREVELIRERIACRAGPPEGRPDHQADPPGLRAEPEHGPGPARGRRAWS